MMLGLIAYIRRLIHPRFNWENWREVADRIPMGVVRRRDGKPIIRNELKAEVFAIGIKGMCVMVPDQDGREFVSINNPDELEPTGERYLFSLEIQGTGGMFGHSS